MLVGSFIDCEPLFASSFPCEVLRTSPHSPASLRCPELVPIPANNLEVLVNTCVHARHAKAALSESRTDMFPLEKSSVGLKIDEKFNTDNSIDN
jgi:hypothetical protein